MMRESRLLRLYYDPLTRTLVGTNPANKDVAGIAATGTYDPLTRTLSGPGAGAAGAISSANRNAATAGQTYATPNPSAGIVGGRSGAVYGSASAPMPNIAGPTSPSTPNAANLASQGYTYDPTTGSYSYTAPTGSTGGYTSLADAQKAQQDYYTKHGSNDPALDAYISNLQKYGGPAPTPTTTPQQPTQAPTPTTTPTTTGNIFQLKKQLAAMGNNLTFTESDAYLTTQQKQAKIDAYNAQKASLQAQIALAENKALQQQQRNMQPTAIQNPTVPTPSGITQQGTTSTPGSNAPAGSSDVNIPHSVTDLTNPFESDPQLKQTYDNMNALLQSGDYAAAALAAQRIQSIQGDNTASNLASAGLTMAGANKDMATALAEKTQQQAKDQADEAQRQALFANAQNQAKFQIDQARAENVSRMNNLQAEMRARNIIAARGGTDTNGLGYLQRVISDGDNALSTLIQKGALANVDFSEQTRQIVETHRLAINQADIQHEKDIAAANAAFSEAYSNISQALTLDNKDKRNQIQNIFDKLQERLTKSDDKRIDTQISLNKTLYDYQKSIETMNHQDKQLDKRLAMQEKNAMARLQYSEKAADRRITRQEVTDEQKEARQIRNDFRSVATRPEIQRYQTIKDGADKASAVLEAAIASGKPLDASVAKEVIGVLYEKVLDPNSVVREGEYARAGLAQDVYMKAEQALKMLAGGDMTGLSPDLIKALNTTIQTMKQAQYTNAAAVYTPFINSLSGFNGRSNHINLDPREVIPPDFVTAEALSSYEQENSQYNFDYGAYSGNKNETTPVDPVVSGAVQSAMPDTGMTMDEIMQDYEGLDLMYTPQSQIIQSSTGSVGQTLAQLGTITQGFDSPISTQNYSSKTVAAWEGKHEGLDIAMRGGTFIPSVTEGTLKEVTYDKGGWGLTAVIQAPDGAEIRYSHLASIDPMLQIGDELPKGREFAQVGNTGNVFSTKGGDGTHLDFRIKVNGKYIDPNSYFS